MKVLDIMTDEIHEYLNGITHLSGDIPYSEWKLKRRIQFFKNKYYPTGKITEDGDYEYWFDIIHPTVNAEVKNLDFDTKHVMAFSKAPVQDFAAIYILNLALDEEMWEMGTAEDINDSVEDFSADGNLLFRKTADGFESCDLMNVFLTNTTARTVDDTDIIERFWMSQSELRSMADVYDNVDAVIKDCGDVYFTKDVDGMGQVRSKKSYELYRRTGEISEKDLFEAQGKKGGDENKYVLARIVSCGLKRGRKDKRYILFAEKMDGKMSDYFVEAHRGPYKGKWWREGLYELLMDYQVRYNDISVQIARGLDWASKVLFAHSDKQTLQNLRTQLKNGSLIRSESIRQIEVRLQGFDQLVNDRNHVIQQVRELSNSFEVVQGMNTPAQTAFRTVKTIDVNATKLYAFLRQKLTLSYRQVFKEFVLPKLVSRIKTKDIIRVTGDPMFVDRFRQIAVDSWYLNNLAKIGPHSAEMRQFIKEMKYQEFTEREPMIQNMPEIWKDVLKRTQITITGENYLVEEVETISNLVQFEQDPARRAYLLDLIYASKGVPVPPAFNPEAVSQSKGEPLKTDKSVLDVPQKPQEPVTA